MEMPCSRRTNQTIAPPPPTPALLLHDENRRLSNHGNMPFDGETRETRETRAESGSRQDEEP